MIYAVGDIHGRADLLIPLLRGVAQDMAETQPRRPLLVFLGDYVDRGGASRSVIDQILTLTKSPGCEVVALKGNHEEALLKFLAEPDFGPTWARHGGVSTLVSYGVRPPEDEADLESWTRVRDAFVKALPAAHRRFFESLSLSLVVGDYAFVHAGIRPGVPLADQVEADLLWIRRGFLDAKGPFEKVIVHGHTPRETPEFNGFQMGLDTGAYKTGVLTAARLEGSDYVYLQAKAGEVAMIAAQ